MTHTCGNCGYSYGAEGDGTVHCGAPWEDKNGVKPIWAERQSSVVTMVFIARGKADKLKSLDCENMPASDGEFCKLYKTK